MLEEGNTPLTELVIGQDGIEVAQWLTKTNLSLTIIVAEGGRVDLGILSESISDLYAAGFETQRRLSE